MTTYAQALQEHMSTTYAQAHKALQEHMSTTDEWEIYLVSSRAPRGSLKVPYADHNFSDIRVWFKARALHIGPPTTLNEARSLDQLEIHDIRRETPQETLARIERWMED